MNISAFGCICFGLVIGWITYRTLRRKTGSGLSDLAGVIGAVGGGAVTALFKETLFSWYSVGLALGFFAYFVMSLILSGKDKTADFMGD